MPYRHVALVGGPGAIPSTLRIQTVRSDDTVVKLPWSAGYEHFVATGEIREVNGLRMAVFNWSRSTRIAE